MFSEMIANLVIPNGLEYGGCKGRRGVNPRLVKLTFLVLVSSREDPALQQTRSAVQEAGKERPSQRVLIVDMDAHQGSGHELGFLGDEQTKILVTYNEDVHPDIQCDIPADGDVWWRPAFLLSGHFRQQLNLCQKGHLCRSGHPLQGRFESSKGFATDPSVAKPCDGLCTEKQQMRTMLRVCAGWCGRLLAEIRYGETPLLGKEQNCEKQGPSHDAYEMRRNRCFNPDVAAKHRGSGTSF